LLVGLHASSTRQSDQELNPSDQKLDSPTERQTDSMSSLTQPPQI